MKIRELLEETEFKEIRAEVNQFVDSMLDEYLQDLYIAEDKQIFDFVWGPVEFNSGEIAILDSPLLQRLRKIKHLGLAGYVYCNADYSRFSHTVGVFFIANKMANIIKKNEKNENNKFDFVQIARLAALFHDAGHMYYSHVSEFYFTEDVRYSRHMMIKEVTVRFSDVVNKKVPLHEILGVLIVNSPKVRELLKRVAGSLEGIKIRNERDYDDIIEYISCLIIGVANDRYILPYHQIINGSVDADKCDYLSRDSRSTNVPVAVDIDRLIHKLSVMQVSKHEQENDIWSDTNEGIFYIPVIKASAEEALNQLLMSRNIMFRSVYYHQKVRTAETMLKNIIADMNVLGIKETNNFCDILQTTDDFFGLNFYSIVTKSNEFNDEQDVKIQEISKKIKSLNYRCLLKRVCAISRENVLIDDERWFDFSKEVFQLSNPSVLQKIEVATAAEYKNVCEMLKVETTGKEVFMISEFPKYTPDNSKVDTKISYGNGEIKKASEVFQTETWMNSKESRNREHYLLTDSKHRGIAFLAFQKAFYDLYGAKIYESASVYSKVEYSDLRREQNTLKEKGYYDDSMELISSIIFEEYEERIKKINSKFKTFEGKNGSVISIDKIYMFLMQFLRGDTNGAKEIKLLIDGILRLLECARYINRKEFDDGMATLLKAMENREKILICPLGGEQDSAKHMMYYFNDIQRAYKNLEVCTSLEDALTRGTDTIVFFDDGAYSGKQVVSIFQEYFGVTERATNEIHVKELNELQKEEIKKKKIVLAYICFNDKNMGKIVDELKKLGLDNIDIQHIFSMGTKTFEERELFVSDEQKHLVRNKLYEVGISLLKTTKVKNGKYEPNWNEERITKAALGYNDSQQLIILKSSVPTYTITAFWKEDGIYNDKRWIPLFERTDK